VKGIGQEYQDTAGVRWHGLKTVGSLLYLKMGPVAGPSAAGLDGPTSTIQQSAIGVDLGCTPQDLSRHIYLSPVSQC
jgi:hypothetical protein